MVTEQERKVLLEDAVREMFTKSSQEKVRPLIERMTNLLMDAYEAGFNVGMEISKFVSNPQQ